MHKKPLSKTELDNLFEFKNGVLWRKSFIRKDGMPFPARKVKMTIRKCGYQIVKIFHEDYLLHRVIFIMHHGNIPDDMEIDHINGNRADNRIENLRLVTQRQNAMNKKVHRNGKLVGTCFHSRNSNSDKLRKKPWQSRIVVNKKRISLGYYHTELEAHQAYIKFIENNL